jgi:hypothetical protein
VTHLFPELDLADVELQAMRLDGEVFRLATAWAPVDEPVTPEMRARAVMAERSPRLVAELQTAAWIWGAIVSLPRPIELCADVRARARLRPGADAVVREVVLHGTDVVDLGGARVTTPLRTIVDLARTTASFSVIRDLALRYDVSRASALASLRGRAAAGRRRAASVLGVSVP